MNLINISEVNLETSRNKVERLNKYCWVDNGKADRSKAVKRLGYIYMCIYEYSTFGKNIEKGLISEKQDIYWCYDGDLVHEANKECDRLWKLKYPNYEG